MLNRISLLTAVCLTASAGLFVTGASADDVTVTRTTSITNEHANVDFKLPAGIVARDLNADKSIDKAFKAITEDGLSKTGFDNLVSKLVDQDRDRIKNSVPNGKSLSNVDGNSNKRLSDLVASINDSFKAKYNHGFDIDVSKDYFNNNFIHVLSGEVSDPQLLVGKWPVEANSMHDMGKGDAGKVNQSDVDQAKNKAFGGDVNLEKGRKVAIAHIPESHGLDSVTLSLIDEKLGGWKFDVPNTMTAEKLYNNLIDNLTYMNSMKDKWPSDINEAHRQFTHAVALSLCDIRAGGTGTAGGTLNQGARPAGNAVDNR